MSVNYIKHLMYCLDCDSAYVSLQAPFHSVSFPHGFLIGTSVAIGADDVPLPLPLDKGTFLIPVIEYA